MTKREEALVILMEECGELIQALKISGLVTDKQIEDRIKVKKEKLMKWSMLYE